MFHFGKFALMSLCQLCNTSMTYQCTSPHHRFQLCGCDICGDSLIIFADEQHIFPTKGQCWSRYCFQISLWFNFYYKSNIIGLIFSRLNLSRVHNFICFFLNIKIIKILVMVNGLEHWGLLFRFLMVTHDLLQRLRLLSRLLTLVCRVVLRACITFYTHKSDRPNPRTHN